LSFEPFIGPGLCTGRILSHGFCANVIGYDLYPNEKAAAENGIKYVPLEELFKTSDVISLHCPLTTETKYIINEAALKTMKPGTLFNQCRVLAPKC
jgi:phosphoglycerate dehydrogenase-like enzyme